MAADTVGEKQAYEKGVAATPDPSILTTSALLREIANLKEQIETRLTGEIKGLEARLAAIDKATEVFSANLTRVPTETQKAVANLQELHDEKFQSIKESLAETALLREEKFHSIQTQFVERDTRVEQTARDTRVAVDAALQAAEKAVNKQNESFAVSIQKSEMATAKQIDQQGALIQTATGALNDKIDDIKDRLTRIEGMGLGKLEAKTDQHTSGSLIVSIIGITIAIISIAVSAFIRLH